MVLVIQLSCNNDIAIVGSLLHDKVKGRNVNPSTGLDLMNQKIFDKDSSQLFGYLSLLKHINLALM